MKAWELEEGKEYVRINGSIRYRVFNGELQNMEYNGWEEVCVNFNTVAKWEFKKAEVKVTNENTKVGEKILVREYAGQSLSERCFLADEHGIFYTTLEEDKFCPTEWKYAIKKEDN